MERDFEVKRSTGSHYDFGARMYDSRLGRWMSVDPLAERYEEMSPYTYVANSPIVFIDPDGKEFINPYEGEYNKAKTDLKDANALFNWSY